MTQLELFEQPKPVVRVLKRNRARCKKCNTVIESRHRHDFQSCPCGVFRDGGLDYLRGGWPGGDYNDWVEDLDEYEDAP